MAALTFATAKTLIANVLGESDAAFLSDIGTFLDQAQRDINRAHPWPAMLRRGWVNTDAVYSAGTVSVTKATTGVTGVATVFPSTVASDSWRFAPSLSDPWNTVSVRGGDTSLTLAEAYRGTTLTAHTYVVYKVDYSLPTDVETVEKVYLHDHTTGDVVEIPRVGPEHLARFGALPESQGAPLAWTDELPPVSGVKQIRVGPYAPDAIYRLEVLYRVQTTDGAASLPQELEDLWVLRAKALAYERDHFQKYQATMLLYREQLAREWEQTSLHADEAFSYGSERVDDLRRDEYQVRLDLNDLEI